MNNGTEQIAVVVRRAALALGVAFGLAPLTTFAADPSLSSIEVQTPCGATTQIPGTGEPGKEGCSGNLLMPLSVGPLTLYYNSQYETYNSTDNPRSLPPSYGFGRGITAFPSLVKDGNDFKLRLGDGTIQRYTYATEGKWASAAQPIGDSSVITYANSKYELQLLPRSEKIIFQAVGSQIVPIQHITEGGGRTDYQYRSTASNAPLIPSSISSYSPGGNYSGGFSLQLSADGNVVTNIIDDRGRSYGLAYSGRGDQRLLTEISWPDGSSYRLTYDTDGRAYLTSVKDPFGRYTFYSFFMHGRLKGVGTSTLSVSYEYSANSITTQKLSSTAAPLQFERVSFDDYGYASEFRSGDGAPSGSQTGILLTKVTHDPIGRITSSTDQLGNSTYFYYNADGSCSSSAADPGTSPLPTCTVSNGVQVTTTRDARNLPTTITRHDPSGSKVTTTLAWGEGAHIKEKRILDSQGRATFSETVDYEGQLPNQFPTRVAVKTSQFFDAYDELGRVLRMTDSSGIESSYAYDQAGHLSAITFGGIATSISQNLSADGTGTLSVSGPGGQQTFTSNFLGTQSSSTLASPPGSRAQLNLSTRSAVQPGVGRTHAAVTDRMTGAGGKVTYQSEATSVLGSDGGTSSSSESRLNIQ